MTTEDHPRYIFDHEDRAVSDLVSALRRPILRAIVRAFGAQVQELEDAASACISDRLLDVAVGAQLDAWGAVVAASSSSPSNTARIAARTWVRPSWG